MISYIAAIATAVTLSVAPVVQSSECRVSDKQKAEWTRQDAGAKTHIKVVSSIEISSLTPRIPYVLSQVEQRILRKALFRSIKIVSSGALA